MKTINKTFIYQNKLPGLPIPSLSSTQSKLFEWIRPLVSHEQFEQTADEIRCFFAENGEAEKLQEKLHAWDQSRKGSWLAPLWEGHYLNHRDPLPHSTNFNVLLKSDPYKTRDTIMETAGKISFLVTRLYHEMIDGKLEPSMHRGTPLDMSQYKKWFRSMRVPQLARDAFYVADFDKKNNHVVILYKNNVYKVPVTNQAGLIYQSADITDAIEATIRTVEDDGVNVGIFTTAERDAAANVYDELNISKVNAETLQTIAESLVVISVDEESKNPKEAIKNLMLNSTNKYFDKTIQIILTKQGEVGFNIEHSGVDGTSISTVISYISKGLKQDPLQIVHTPQKPLVEKKEWELSESLQATLAQFQKEHVKRKKDYFLQSSVFTNFGADQIKKMKISPDAFFHMALQIAQYRTYGQLKSVYEPVSVRSFYEGRTESARATSMEKRNVVEAMASGKETNEYLYSLMQTASTAHSQRIRDCQKGFGIERHLYGLEQMYYLFGADLGLKELPAIFLDEGYTTLRHEFISTSGMAYENAKYRMFAPVEKEGHGVAYFILDDSISINISSYTENKIKGNQLMEHMVEALNELQVIAEE